MIDANTVENMVVKLGDMTLEALQTWFPEEKIEELKDIINQSEKLVLSENKVILKEVKVHEKKENITYDELIDLINDYNDKTEEEFEKLNSRKDLLKIKAVAAFLEERYDIKPYKNDKLDHVFSLYQKWTDILIGYAVIVPVLNEDICKIIDSLFDLEMVFIYCTEKNEVGELDTLKEFFIKPCEVIIQKYAVSYKLEKIPQQILKITEIREGIIHNG